MEKKKTGRNSKYETHVKPFLKEIKKKTEEGVTEKAISQALHITEQSLRNYKAEHKELRDALDPLIKGKDKLKELVNSGIEAAHGYYKDIETTVYLTDENGEKTLKQQTVVRQWFPPNPILNKFYIKNFGKELGFVEEPLEYDLKKRKADTEEELDRLKIAALQLPKTFNEKEDDINIKELSVATLKQLIEQGENIRQNKAEIDKSKIENMETDEILDAIENENKKQEE